MVNFWTARRLTATMVGLIAAIGVAAGVVALWPDNGKSGNPIRTDPMPTQLFPVAELARVVRRERAERARAARALAAWLKGHPVRNDAAFAAFVRRVVPPPPSRSELEGELPVLRGLEASRTPDRARIVGWLFVHGKGDVWRLFARQYGQLDGPVRGAAARAAVKETIALANTINTQLKQFYREPHPLQLDSALNPIVPHPGATKAQTVLLDRTKYGYPSNHTNISYAAATVLARYEPARAAELFTVADQVSYSRLVAGIHFPGDLYAGAFEGSLIGGYEAHFAKEAP